MNVIDKGRASLIDRTAWILCISKTWSCVSKT